MTSITVEPKRIVWEPNDRTPRDVVFWSEGVGEMMLRVEAPGTDLPRDFFWAEIPGQRLCSARRVGSALEVKLTVHPPEAGTATMTSFIPFHATDRQDLSGQSGYVELRNDARNSVVENEVLLVDLYADPPGGDLDGEGEFIVIENQLDTELDLNGCTLHQAVFKNSGKLREADRLLTTFSRRSSMATDFDKTCRLPPHARLKVLSRAKRSSDRADDPLRHYIGAAAPVWNNAGDIVTLRNNMGQTLVHYGWGTQRQITPIGTRLTPRGPGVERQIHATHCIVGSTGSIDTAPYIEPAWDLEDGDEISFVTQDAALADEYRRTGRVAKGSVKDSLFGRDFLPSGRWLQNGQVLPAETHTNSPDWPLWGAPAMSLLADFEVRDASDRCLFFKDRASIGGSDRFTLTMEGRGKPKFRFGVNDRNLGDNQGFFEVDVIVWRR
jgi:hypothetical protein